MAKDRMHSIHHTTELHERRERVFLLFAGIFLGSMTMLNILGITRFIHLGPLALAIGVLPYPLTFLCTDFISEFYGRSRANYVVWIGLLLNVIIMAFLWIGHQIPPIEEAIRPDWLPVGSWTPPPWQTLTLASPINLFGENVVQIDLFEVLFRCSRASVFASMIAYIAAQFCDVYLYHFWKNLTKGKHLWLRNNGSTMISQLIDAITVIFITFGSQLISGDKTLQALFILVASNYLFKLVVAAIDTIPFYIGVHYLKSYLQIDPTQGYNVATRE